MSKVKEFYLADDYSPSPQELALDKEYWEDHKIVPDDDWELGPVCQLGDEECEACQ